MDPHTPLAKPARDERPPETLTNSFEGAVRQPLAVSVVVVNKGERLLSETLDALHPYLGNVVQEVVVVDASGYALDDIRRTHRWVRWIDYVQPYGLGITIAHQRNVGVAHSEGDVIVFTDSGCIPEDKWLERLIGPILSEDESVTCGPARSIGTSVYSRPLDVDLVDGKYVTMATTINLAFRRDVFTAVGGFDESFGAAEDIDFTWRLVERGFRLRWVDDAVVLHDWGTPRRQMRRAFFYGKGGCRLLRKHPERISEAVRNRSVSLVYAAYLVGLPLTAVLWWYPLVLVWPIWRHRKEELRWLVLADHLVMGAGFLYELIRPGT